MLGLIIFTFSNKQQQQQTHQGWLKQNFLSTINFIEYLYILIIVVYSYC